METNTLDIYEENHCAPPGTRCSNIDLPREIMTWCILSFKQQRNKLSYLVQWKSVLQLYLFQVRFLLVQIKIYYFWIWFDLSMFIIHEKKLNTLYVNALSKFSKFFGINLLFHSKLIELYLTFYLCKNLSKNSFRNSWILLSLFDKICIREPSFAKRR